MNKNAIGHGGTNLPNLTVLPAIGPERRRAEDQRAPNRARPEGARKIEQSIHYMMQHLSQPLQVAELAETAHTSPSHFYALFKRWAGLSPIDYFIRLRMSRACRLLAATSMSVKEVAAVLGYDDPFYFSRVFKSVNGTPPTDYRLRMKEPEQGQSLGAGPRAAEEALWPGLPPGERLAANGAGGRMAQEAQGRLQPARRIMSLR
jgi:AraC-like DNA-binding protein